MTEEDAPARKTAIEAAAMPHESHAEMVARHAALKAQAAASQSSAAPAPRAAADRSSTSYALGNVLGKKLKGLFRK